MRASGRRLLALVVAALVATPACGGDGEEPAQEATEATAPAAAEVAEELIGEPGTAFGDGFEVVEGSRRLGPVFAHSIRGRRLTTAVLAVDGDPISVWNAYLAQARAAGLSPHSMGRWPCSLEGRNHSGPIEQRPPRGIAVHLRCLALASLDPTSGSDSPGLVSFDLRRSGPGARPATSHLVIDTDDGGPVVDSTEPAEERATWAEPFDAPPVPDPPAAGEPFPDAHESYVLEPGSELVGSVAHAPCATGGFRIVVALSDDAAAVVERYRRQFRNFDGDLTEQVVDGDQVLAGSLGAAGGGSIVMVAVTPADGSPSSLLLHRCDD